MHDNFIVGNANERVPFEDNLFNSIFSNIVYWLDDPSLAFKEIARILKPNGRCCVMLPNNTFPEFSFYYSMYLKKQDKNFQFLDLLDRGRISDNIKHAKTGEEWLEIITKNIFQRRLFKYGTLVYDLCFHYCTRWLQTLIKKIL